MKKILVTGATSFIGIRLIHKLLSLSYIVYAVVRPNSCKISLLGESEHLHIVELGMEQYGTLFSKINEECEIFCSLAWNGTRGEERENEIKQKNNYEYSIQSVKEAIKLGCKTIISAGSQAEYGLVDGMITEDMESHPNTAYGKYKLEFYNEALKICRKNKISFKEPRFFSLYGEDDNENTMILSILNRMVHNQSCKLTECIQLWDYLYISDAIQGLIYLIEKDCMDGIYNFGSGITKPLKEYVLMMKNITNTRSAILFGAVPYPLSGMVSIYPDVSKLKRETGWKPQISFEEGIKRIVLKLKDKRL